MSDKGSAPLTGGTSPVRARIGVCEHGALNINLSVFFKYESDIYRIYSVFFQGVIKKQENPIDKQQKNRYTINTELKTAVLIRKIRV